jgi:hypothetical protein
MDVSLYVVATNLHFLQLIFVIVIYFCFIEISPIHYLKIKIFHT